MTWPRSGTMRSGTAYLLRPSAPRTFVTGSSSWPTPKASEPGWTLEDAATIDGEPPDPNRRVIKEGVHRTWGLQQAVEARELAADADGSRATKGKDRPDEGGLAKAVQLWPTPKSTPSGPDYARAGREESGGDDLATAVAKREMFPTPLADTADIDTMERLRYSRAELGRRRDSGEPYETQSSGMLSPDWVEWLMGFPIGWTETRR